MADVPGSIAALLADYFAGIGCRRWKPGVLDCGTFAADWALLRGLGDPIADLRGRYANERQFMRIIRREGEFLACCGARLAGIGLVESDAPQPGDILIVDAPFAVRRSRIQRRPTCAIALNACMRAVVTSDRGLVHAPDSALPTLKVWSFGVGNA